MDETKYLELRHKLQQQAETEASHQEWIRRYVLAVAHRIDTQHGRDKRTCDAGSMQGSQFVVDEFPAKGSKACFAIRVQFHAMNGDPLFEHVVEFRAKIVGNVLRIELHGSDEAVQLSFDESRTDEGAARIMRIVDAEVEAAVESALQNAKGVGVDLDWTWAR